MQKHTLRGKWRKRENLKITIWSMQNKNAPPTYKQSANKQRKPSS